MPVGRAFGPLWVLVLVGPTADCIIGTESLAALGTECHCWLRGYDPQQRIGVITVGCIVPAQPPKLPKGQWTGHQKWCSTPAAKGTLVTSGPGTQECHDPCHYLTASLAYQKSHWDMETGTRPSQAKCP